MSSNMKDKLEKFSEDDNLKKLKEMLEEKERVFNPFKVLKIDESENRHSDVLAWLLDPKGHHGLGDKVFKQFLLNVLKVESTSNKSKHPDTEEVGKSNYIDLEVIREKSNIDILAYSKKQKLVVVIENKVYAGEDIGDGKNKRPQLDCYAETVEKEYKNYKHKVFIYLTLDGTPSKGGKDLYIPFKHEDIYHIVSEIIADNPELFKDGEKKKVLDFIEFYLKLLEEKAMSDKKLDELCAKLYIEHHEAIERIIERGKITKPKFADKIWVELDRRDLNMKREGSTDFVSNDWTTKNGNYPATFYFSVGDYVKSKKIMFGLYCHSDNYKDYENFKKILKDELSKINIEGNPSLVDIYIRWIDLDESGCDKNDFDYDEVAQKVVDELEKEKPLIEKVIRAVTKAMESVVS